MLGRRGAPPTSLFNGFTPPCVSLSLNFHLTRRIFKIKFQNRLPIRTDRLGFPSSHLQRSLQLAIRSKRGWHRMPLHQLAWGSWFFGASLLRTVGCCRNLRFCTHVCVHFPLSSFPLHFLVSCLEILVYMAQRHCFRLERLSLSTGVVQVHTNMEDLSQGDSNSFFDWHFQAILLRPSYFNHMFTLNVNADVACLWLIIQPSDTQCYIQVFRFGFYFIFKF